MSAYKIPTTLLEALNKSKEDTRLLAFKKLVETKKLPKRRAEVATALLLALEPMTSAMLEKWCSKKPQYQHLKRCTICGRLNELEEANVIKVVDTKVCLETGSTAKYYSVVECL